MHDNITTFRFAVGDILFNSETIKSLPGVPDFKKGYYKIITIRDGYFTKKLRPEHRKSYEIQRCTKNGKLMKYNNGFSCGFIDREVSDGRMWRAKND